VSRKFVSREKSEPEFDLLDPVPVPLRLARIQKKVARRARKTRKERR
jgi:hypothetical protein